MLCRKIGHSIWEYRNRRLYAKIAVTLFPKFGIFQQVENKEIKSKKERKPDNTWNGPQPMAIVSQQEHASVCGGSLVMNSIHFSMHTEGVRDGVVELLGYGTAADYYVKNDPLPL